MNRQPDIHSEKVKRLLGNIPRGVIRAGWTVNAVILALLLAGWLLFR